MSGARSTFAPVAKPRGSVRLVFNHATFRDDERRSAGEWLAQIWREHRWAARRLLEAPGVHRRCHLDARPGHRRQRRHLQRRQQRAAETAALPHPDSLVRVFAQHPRFVDMPLPPADFHALREQTEAFSGIAAFFREGHEFRGSAGPENLEGLFVTAGYFELLGTRAALGRTFTEEDERPGGADRVILSDRIWRTRLGADPAIIGRTVNLSRRPFEVIGVIAPGLEHVGGRQRSLPHGETVDFLDSLTLNPANLPRSARLLNTVGRLAQASIEQANAELDRLARLQEQRWPDSHTGWRVNAVPLVDEIVGSARPVLFAVFGAVGCVLLIACGNVACLTLGRSIARTREHAMRAALGATGARLAREIMIESWYLPLPGPASGCRWRSRECGRSSIWRLRICRACTRYASTRACSSSAASSL